MRDWAARKRFQIRVRAEQLMVEPVFRNASLLFPVRRISRKNFHKAPASMLRRRTLLALQTLNVLPHPFRLPRLLQKTRTARCSL